MGSADALGHVVILGRSFFLFVFRCPIASASVPVSMLLMVGLASLAARRSYASEIDVVITVPCITASETDYRRFEVWNGSYRLPHYGRERALRYADNNVSGADKVGIIERYRFCNFGDAPMTTCLATYRAVYRRID